MPPSTVFRSHAALIPYRPEPNAAELAARVTFADAVKQFMAHREKTNSNKRLNGYWRRTLEQHAVPILGTLSVAAIEKQHVLKVIEPLWATNLETAQRVRSRIQAVLDAATARGQRSGENPAAWNVLKPVIGTAKAHVRHYPSLPWKELPDFVKLLRADTGLAASALHLTILTACRSAEVLNARWDEIDGNVWTIPPERTKMRRPHRVPLAPQARDPLNVRQRARGNAALRDDVPSSVVPTHRTSV